MVTITISLLSCRGALLRCRLSIRGLCLHECRLDFPLGFFYLTIPSEVVQMPKAGRALFQLLFLSAVGARCDDGVCVLLLFSGLLSAVRTNALKHTRPIEFAARC